MSLATDPLPVNPSALRIFAADLQAELARKDIEIAANAAEIHAKTLHIGEAEDAARGAAACAVRPLLGEARWRNRATRIADRRARTRMLPPKTPAPAQPNPT